MDFDSALTRRRFLSWTSSRGVALGLGATGLATLAAACGDDDGGSAADTTLSLGPTDDPNAGAQVLVGDVVDFSLVPGDWPGEFGFVTMAIRAGMVDGAEVFYVRTDTSDEAYATAQQLVFVPKIAALSGDGLSGNAYVDEANPDAPTVFSTEPGRDDYSPAWTLNRITWTSEPRALGSEQDVLDAAGAGALSVERTGIVVNAGIVKWSNGEMAVDQTRQGYLGEGQLLEPIDTANRRATFKLGQCYPGSRYFVLDHSVAPAAEMTSTVASPGLHDGPSAAGATGRTNVFMNGLAGPGPMGFQPSAFDFDAGHPAWSPYWDHYTYGWRDAADPRVLRSQEEIHAARDAGELDEFPGTPDMAGVFTVNCPVPILAPASYEPPT